MRSTNVSKEISKLAERFLVDVQTLLSARPAKTSQSRESVKPMTAAQQRAWPNVLKLLRAGKLNNRAIAKKYPAFKWTNVRSYRSHVTMGTYRQ